MIEHLCVDEKGRLCSSRAPWSRPSWLLTILIMDRAMALRARPFLRQLLQPRHHRHRKLTRRRARCQSTSLPRQAQWPPQQRTSTATQRRARLAPSSAQRLLRPLKLTNPPHLPPAPPLKRSPSTTTPHRTGSIGSPPSPPSPTHNPTTRPQATPQPR